MDIYSLIKIDEDSRIPKYKQIVDSIVANIASGNLKVNQKIPSINNFSEEFYLSRDTVGKAYNILKERKIITSIRGKGNYITRTELISKLNILFLVNKMSSYKMKIYKKFIETMGPNTHVDLHIYYCDEYLFSNLLDKYIGAYDYYVIMPHFKTEDLKHISAPDRVLKQIKEIPENKLVILDNLLDLGIKYTSVYQDFENDIYHALGDAFSEIEKYNKFILFYPQTSQSPYPRRILHGFKKFCVEKNLDFEVLDYMLEDLIIKKGDLFLTIEETDLVSLINRIRAKKLVLGENVGVISYNDTPLKELLGISVVSTDFDVLGRSVAELILNKQVEKIKNPFHFIQRKSL
ncbi:GntR family transcriptional regulator [Wenyingzhuangia aestuarii]|uniref:GntR family transcriptional regulator n=1 Tax=Wenyingzhuangia aestuarii TaxID=1647582 RepID=UPI00143C611D|nr:GntR family transcriptional regulator [Wenyingzhuangia aestuarii]NJB82737.1 DNA-binding transcriptional regulator YhcF (GntR family) [Wenyingzhuangia aestuarii]